MKIIIIDGMSGAGKTTVKKMLGMHYLSDALLMDRFTASSWMYDKIRGVDRSIEIIEFEKTFEQIYMPYNILLTCDETVALDRCTNRERLPIYKSLQEKVAMLWYNKYVCQYKNTKLIDTTDYSLVEVFEIIKNYIGA